MKLKILTATIAIAIAGAASAQIPGGEYPALSMDEVIAWVDTHDYEIANLNNFALENSDRIDIADREIARINSDVTEVDNRATTSIASTNNRINAAIGRLDSRIDRVEREMSAGIASALAVNGIPQAVDKSSNTLGAGVGTYNGRSALAVGFSRRFDRITVKVAGTYDSESNAGGSVGIGYSF